MKRDTQKIKKLNTTGKTWNKKQENIYVTVAKDHSNGQPFNQIAIETGPDRENALINITFANGQIWSGTFEELKLRLITLS